MSYFTHRDEKRRQVALEAVSSTVVDGSGPEGPAGPEDALAGPARSLRADAIRRLKKNKLAVAGLIWIIIIILIAITADLWVPRWLGDPVAIDSTTAAERMLLSPSTEHPFGTDKLGRDVASRVIYGARVSLMVGVLAVAIAVILGLIMGALAAYYGGLWDAIIMRTADVFFAFPYILFAIVLIALLGPGFQNVFIAIGVLGWPSIARVFRSSILSVKENEYVDAARAMGASTRRILIRHIMPNAVAPIIVYATMSVGGAILTEAALSFLGMGVQPPDPSWGNMLNDAQSFMLTAPWMMIYPGVAILTTVLAFVLLGDGLRDALDVKLKE
ncbi:MAG: ABC transporter permease [Actinobacteria bacterium]|nr:ABC transporter permease [Actinomycetota bacterium]